MAFPTNIGPRTQAAWNAILATLQDGDWHTHAELVMEASLESDLNDKSIEELIRKGYRTHHYRRITNKAPGQTKLQGAIYQRRVMDPKEGRSDG